MIHYRTAAALQEEKLRQAAAIPKRKSEKKPRTRVRRKPLLGLRSRQAT